MPRRLNAVLHFAMLLCLCGCRLPQSGIAPSDSSERGPAFEDIHKIDVHAHIFEEMPKSIEMMRSNNISIINVCNRGRDGHLETMHPIMRQMYRSHPNFFRSPRASISRKGRHRKFGVVDPKSDCSGQEAGIGDNRNVMTTVSSNEIAVAPAISSRV